MKKQVRANRSDSAGRKYGRWTVLRKISGRMWMCRCLCGVKKPVKLCNLISGTSLSCGCLHRELTSKLFKKHGESNRGKTPEYSAWVEMKKRCNNSGHISYKNYGGRGISVCSRWLNSFSNFLSDMGRRPSSGHSLERIDFSGNYNPQNCRWATRVEQARNTRSNIFVKCDGKTKTVAEWAVEKRIKYGTLAKRIRSGWSHEDALNKIVQKHCK
jgi:hypothetical protein